MVVTRLNGETTCTIHGPETRARQVYCPPELGLAGEGMARALGETAPLLMIGMVAFIADVPASMGDPATVLPVQVFLWADSPERGFVERTSAAIMVLLAFLIAMNAIAVVLRKRFERRW